MQQPEECQIISSVAYITRYGVSSFVVTIFYSHYLVNCYLKAIKEVAYLKRAVRQKYCID